MISPGEDRDEWRASFSPVDRCSNRARRQAPTALAPAHKSIGKAVVK
jgi:hypothetical protein